MIHRHWTATLLATLTALFLVLVSPARADMVSGPSDLSHIIDLANMPDNTELTGNMLTSPKNSTIQNLSDAVNFSDWHNIGRDTLNAPRQHTTVWLKAAVHNSSDQALIRWLVLEPWRVNRVDAFFINPASGEQLRHDATGLDIPLQDRTVSNGKTIVPVTLSPGETQQFYLNIYSDSLPFISIKSWEPVAYSQSINDSRIFQIALFAAILTLLIILLLQFNVGLIITGIWLLVAFIFETEKDGFFSNYLLSFLEDYSANLRLSAWIFTEQLFLMTSFILLGLNQHRHWRIFIQLTAASAFIMTCLTFVLNGASIRSLGIMITGLYAISWLFMIIPGLRIKRTQQLAILALLSIYWVVSVFLLLGYAFNFYYTSTFAVTRIYVEIIVALALIMTYSWQQKQQIKVAKNALIVHESQSRKRLEQAVKDRTEDLNSALETAQKGSTAKVNFLGQISHDLRAPLTAILGYAQLQTAGLISDQKANQIIQDRALYMKDLINSLVDYVQDTAADNDEQSDIYLIAFIDNLVNQTHFLANKQNNRFQLKIETELPTVIRCNHTQLQRILLNLLDNAAKYTVKGYISLSIIVDSNQDEQPSLIFRINDTGRGIAPHQLEHIYTPFYQSSESNPGSGLGLPICFELTERMGGSLELKSELGVGTVAICTIPYIAGDELLATLSLPVAQDLLPMFDAQRQKAWIIEDSKPISELLDGELTEMGFDTALAMNAEAFIETITNDCETPAIIITDYQLPRASGLAVLHAAREQWPNVPVLLLSATQNSTPQTVETPSLGFCAYLSKPIDLLALRLKLARLCNLTQIV
ncbi:ATP-binding protein [Oceanisphaera ostreae]|uniref:histidine kinase n=1 Tax=Oceanisphaera ostreae TaxID=914151 RepID=A0ABW3KG65_9GAMM